MTTNTTDNRTTKQLKKTILEQSNEISRLRTRVSELVDDIHTIKADISNFKTKTFSNYAKKDVIKALNNSILNGLIEESCYWITECICSGYSIELFEKLVILSSKIVHINSPNLPQYLWRRYQCVKI